MAPTIIVGDDEDAGDVAARLLDLADNQRQVKVRTDLPSAAYDVDDKTYKAYVGRHTRSDDELRVNSVQDAADADDAEGAITTDDEVPDAARNIDPSDVEQSEVGGPVRSDDELPDLAVNALPPSNGDAPNSGDTGTATDGDAGNQLNSDPDARTDGTATEPEQKAQPRKRAPRKAAKSTAPAAGSDGK